MENFRLNPPPSWPPFPVGWAPAPGWQPGPDLPIPLGWQLWVPVEAREAAPTEVDLDDYIDPFAAYLPGATTINKAPVPVFAAKPVFKERRAKTVHISTWLTTIGLLGGAGYATYSALQAGGLIHAAVTLAAILSVTAVSTGLYTMVTGRQSWAQLRGGRNSGTGPVILGLITCAVILATPFFGLDVPAWVPEITIPGL